MPSVPALALGVVTATEKAAGSGRRSSTSRSSHRQSSSQIGGESGGNGIGARPNRYPTMNSLIDPKDSPDNNLTSTVKEGSLDQQVGAGSKQQVGDLGGGNSKDAGQGVDGKAGAAGSDSQAMAPLGGTTWAGGTVPVPVKRRMSVQVAAARIVEKVRHVVVGNAALVACCDAIRACRHFGRSPPLPT